ncbi:ATP-binding protein, partial [Kitasatospora sp. NPDC093558]|uniref:sensor histidine kinase n=1 Tax=Kitasatospora sp. NPDC093558 TaxID=3155201 RepID=UPI00342209E3
GRSLRVTLDLRPDPLPALPAAVEVAVYRISGEALNNVVRHSGATSARLTLHAPSDRVTVEVADNGAGFPTGTSTAGVGLRSMAERAEELGGTFTAVNAPAGAVVRAVLPRERAG